MRFFLPLIITIYNLYAFTIDDLITLYKQKEYEKACVKGITIFEKFKKNEELVSIYGLSCLKSDYIDRLAVPIVVLKNSKNARANAAYFATILAQKKLLMHSIADNIDISGLAFPKTDHIISKIFTDYVEKKYKKNGNIYIFNDIEPGFTYQLYLKKDEKPMKMIILKLKDNKIVQRHKFW